ncbi:DUF2806 domain-containing protein [Flavivirga aquatica]|nr:DUF2806 domain-containing protein [Flavivirga aquatica]
MSEELSNIEPEDLLSTVDGIPLPPAIKKNLWKSLGRLVTGLVDIPVAYLESKAERIKGETVALNVFRSKVAEKASDEFMEDEQLMNRAVNYYGSKLLKEQLNREKVIDKTVEELKLNPPENDTNQEIDEDWLDLFSRISETKSNEEVQLILSKILAGEIKNPGSFGPKSLHTLTILDQKTAKIFQNFCSVSYESEGLGSSFTSVICEPFGGPGSNGLSEFNLNYSNLAQLQDAGLIQYDLNAWREIPPILFVLPFKFGNKEFCLKQKEEKINTSIRTKVINFTKVGLELRKVLQMESNDSYNEKTIDWIKNKFKLE